MASDKFIIFGANNMMINNENPYITKNMINLVKSIKKDNNSFIYVDSIVDYFINLNDYQMFIDNDTGNDEKYEKYLDGLDKPEYHTSFIELIKIISDLIEDDTKKINIIYKLINKYIIDHTLFLRGRKSIKELYIINHHIIYNQWINSNIKSINKNYKIGYIYYQLINSFDGYIGKLAPNFKPLSYQGYYNINKRMDNLYKTLKEIFSNDDIKYKDVENTKIEEVLPVAPYDVLFHQNKELQLELEDCKKQISKLEKEKDMLNKKFNDIKLLLEN